MKSESRGFLIVKSKMLMLILLSLLALAQATTDELLVADELLAFPLFLLLRNTLVQNQPEGSEPAFLSSANSLFGEEAGVEEESVVSVPSFHRRALGVGRSAKPFIQSAARIATVITSACLYFL
jgi:hypothetical protein